MNSSKKTATSPKISSTERNCFDRAVDASPASMGAANIESKRPLPTEVIEVNSLPQPSIECGIGPFMGFSTAGRGVPIAISEESLANATKALSDLASACDPAAGREGACGTFGNDLTKAYEDKNASFSTKVNCTNDLHCGFTTAGKGVDITISEESLTKATMVLHGLAAPMPMSRISSSVPDSDPTGKGFAMLTPDSISVSSKKSQDALASKTLVEAIKPCLGFGAEGRGTKTNLSDDSLAHARKSLSGLTPTSMNYANFSSRSCLGAVGRKQATTASDRLPSESVVHRGSSLTSLVATVESDEVITKVRAVHSGLSLTTLGDAQAGFSTAGSGMVIAISQDSFAKAAKVLNGSAPTSSVDSICSPFPCPDAIGTERARFASTTHWAMNTKDLSVSASNQSIRDSFIPRQAPGLCDSRKRKSTMLSERCPSSISESRSGGVASTNTMESGVHVGLDEVRRPPSAIGLAEGVRPLTPFGDVGSSAEMAVQRRNSEAQNVYRQSESNSSIITNGIISTIFESKGLSDYGCAQMSRGIESRFDIRDSLLTPSDETIRTLQCAANVAEPEHILRLNTSRSLCHVFGVHCTTMDVNSTNATSLRFDRDTGRPLYYLGDRHSKDGVGGANDMRQALSRCCIDTGILSDRWFLNHSRWIVWKLASIERRFPREAGGKHLTFQRLVCELKSRYDKEVICGMRSPIRKVLNKDVSSTTTMILCVSKIHGTGERSSGKPSRSKPLAIELTDGWYGVTAVVDEQLKDKLDKRIIRTGTKIAVCNSILIGAGYGMDPLDASYDSMKPDSPVYMILSANATRLAAWNSRLGFVKPSKRFIENRGAFKCRRLSDIIVGGGIVPCIDLLVCRIYPTLHFQRNGLKRNHDSLSFVLTETEEYARRAEYEQRRTQAMDGAIEMVDMECFENVEDEALTVWDTLQDDGQNSEPRAGPSERDRQIADNWIRQREALIRNRMQNQVEATRDEIVVECGESTPFISLFVKSATEGTCDGALLTVWNATESQEAILNEGEVVTFRNLVVKSSKRDGLLQLTARESTPMHDAQYDVETRRSIGFVGRSFVPFFLHHTLSRKLCLGVPLPFPAQLIDIAGSIVRVVQCNVHQFKIYLSDDSGLVSRIDRSCSAEVASAFVSMSVNTRGTLQPIAFRDVRVMPYDYVECCAVAAFTHNSSFSTTNRVCASMALTTNHDDELARLVAVAMEAGTSSCAIAEYLSSCPVSVAIGRIVGCEKSVRGSTHVFNVKVDCGSTTLHSWEVPSFLMDDVLAVIGDGRRPTSLSFKKSKRSGSSRGFQRALMASGVLLRFVLQAKMTSYEVRQLCIADCHAISALHLMVQRKRLAQHRQVVRE